MTLLLCNHFVGCESRNLGIWRRGHDSATVKQVPG
jgi:hypothetical protein